MSVAFNNFAAQVRKSRHIQPFQGTLLALDPGETTGWSVWYCKPGEDDVMIACGQLPSWPLQTFVPGFKFLISKYGPTRIVYEQYRVYEWKTESHAWSDVPTLRIIGSLETILLLQDIPFSNQSAQVAKQFVTDDKLKSWNLYERGQRHSRDSMRHACYFLCFGVTSQKVPGT